MRYEREQFIEKSDRAMARRSIAAGADMTLRTTVGREVRIARMAGL